MSKADSSSGMQYAPEHRCQLFDMLLKNIIYWERILIMEKNENKRTTTAPKKNASGKTKIIVERTFGEGDLLELYAEYVAGKIRQRMKAWCGWNRVFYDTLLHTCSTVLTCPCTRNTISSKNSIAHMSFLKVYISSFWQNADYAL